MDESHAEEYLLYRMLSSYDAANDAIEDLKSDDFKSEFNAAVFSCMKILYKQDCKIDQEEIFTIMDREFPKLANFENLVALERYQYSDSTKVKTFIEVIKEDSRKRRLRLLGMNLFNESEHQGNKSFEIRDQFLLQIEKMFSDSHGKTAQSIKELSTSEYEESGMSVIPYIKDQTEKYRKGIRVLKGLPTGYYSLDSTINGFVPGHYIIVGARPGAGKTTLVLNFIHSLVKKNIPVGFFSLEMTAHQAMMKLVGIETGLGISKIEGGGGSDEDLGVVEDGIVRMRSYPLHIDDSSCLYASALVARAKRMVMAHGIKILFIDYIGEVNGDGKFATKELEVQHVSRALRGIAKDLNIPVVCVCQLNRDSEKESRNPRKSDLRESGQIEADAHTIILLRKYDQEEKSVEGEKVSPSHNQPGRVSLHIVKNRFGEQRVINLHFEGEKSKFSEIDYPTQQSTDQEFDDLADFARLEGSDD